MSDTETIKEIRDNRDLEKASRKLSLDDRREVLKLDGDIKDRLAEVKTKQPKLFS